MNHIQNVCVPAMCVMPVCVCVCARVCVSQCFCVCVCACAVRAPASCVLLCIVFIIPASISAKLKFCIALSRLRGYSVLPVAL